MANKSSHLSENVTLLQLGAVPHRSSEPQHHLHVRDGVLEERVGSDFEALLRVVPDGVFLRVQEDARSAHLPGDVYALCQKRAADADPVEECHDAADLRNSGRAVIPEHAQVPGHAAVLVSAEHVERGFVDIVQVPAHDVLLDDEDVEPRLNDFIELIRRELVKLLHLEFHNAPHTNGDGRCHAQSRFLLFHFFKRIENFQKLVGKALPTLRDELRGDVKICLGDSAGNAGEGVTVAA